MMPPLSAMCGCIDPQSLPAQSLVNTVYLRSSLAAVLQSMQCSASCVGLVVHDTWRAVECKMGSEVACSEPVAMENYDNIFSLKTPLCDPTVIRKIVKSNFESNAELVTVRLPQGTSTPSAHRTLSSHRLHDCPPER